VYGSGSGSNSQNGTMLGGKRTIQMDLIAGNGFSTASVGDNLHGLEITNGQTEMTLVTITWNDMASPVDIVAISASSIIVTVDIQNAIESYTEIELSDGTNIATQRKYHTNYNGQDLEFLLADFLPGTLDFSHITSIKMIASLDNIGSDISYSSTRID